MEQKAKKEAEETLRCAISIFAGNVAHDLRVPLTSMSLNIDLFARYLDTFIKNYEQYISLKDRKKLASYVDNLLSLLPKMKNIIKNMNSSINATLKAMQRLAAGTVTKEDFIICEIEPYIKDAIAAYPLNESETQLIHINIDYNFEFSTYPILFYKIIFNLMNNALAQINKNQKGEIFITTSQNEHSNLLHFKDTAGGASAIVIASMFQGYQTTKKEGTGVGLSFSKLAMKDFGGDITCESVEGDYIEFILSFPKLVK
ncbi:MAG: sensor histidine kinase [Gammaproteobacteria bacterium]